MRLFSFIAMLVGIASFVNAQSSSLQRVTAFSAGPTTAQMHVYLPPNRQAKPPILIAIHYCQGTAQAFYSQTAAYARQADIYGFIIIYPSSGNTGACWDVASTQSLTHNGGGDSKTIINMVAYAVANYGADANRVYVLGGSSGAMMGNVLAGAYPDIIKGISVYAGVPDGCFYMQAASVPRTGQEPGWNSQCAQGTLIKTAQQWGDQTRGYYSGYTGPRPKIALWHGVQDNVLRYANFGESLKQWSNVLGVSFSRNVTNNPQSGFTRMEYGDGTKLVGFSAQNYAHNVPNFVDFDLAWFGLNTRTTPTTTPSQQTTAATSRSTSGTTRVTTTSQSGTVGSAAPKWGQCGGQGWTGPTTCVSGSTCTYSNQWYSQCL